MLKSINSVRFEPGGYGGFTKLSLTIMDVDMGTTGEGKAAIHKWLNECPNLIYVSEFFVENWFTYRKITLFFTDPNDAMMCKLVFNGTLKTNTVDVGVTVK